MKDVTALRLRNSQRAPILQIPIEILIRILRQVIEASFDYEEAVQLITSTCYFLHTLVFDTPELWGFVNMRGSLGIVFQQRCHWNPITIEISLTGWDVQVRTRIFSFYLWKNVPNLLLTRLKSMGFCGTRENFMEISWIFNYHMPNLQTLALISGFMEEGVSGI